MITFYHSPLSRSTRILALIKMMGIEDKIDTRIVTIRRNDGTGQADAGNPHPEGKVPLLVLENGAELRETNAIILYLTDRFGGPLGRSIEDPQRADYLKWLFYYGNVLEPVMIAAVSGVAEHPSVFGTFRSTKELAAVLSTVLAERKYLLGDEYSAADLLMASAFLWFPAFTPDIPAVKDWVARCGAMPEIAAARDADLSAMAA